MESTVTQNKEEDTVSFPCIENPFRVSLCCNEQYLWCLNGRGRLGARNGRGERSEFQLIETNEKNCIMLINHKFGSVLSIVKSRRGEHEVRCVPQANSVEQETKNDDNNNNNNSTEEKSDLLEASFDNKDSLTSSSVNESNTKTKDDMTEDEFFSLLDSGKNTDDDQKGDTTTSTDDQQANADSDESSDEEDLLTDESTPPCTVSDVPMDAQKWRFMKVTDGYACLKNVHTGERLGIDRHGKFVLFADDAPLDTPCLWMIEPMTGEICYLSNVKLDSRLRCDMGGRLSMSSNWMGWEVFRFLEAGDGYVLISSWTHSEWFLKCDATGMVQTGKHNDMLMHMEWCSLWAVERAPSGKGVVIRSKRYGRFLCVNKAKNNALTLATYHPCDEQVNESGMDGESYQKEMIQRQGDFLQDAIARKNNNNSNSQRSSQGGDSVISQADLLSEAMARKNSTPRNSSSTRRRRWFRRSQPEEEENSNNADEEATSLHNEYDTALPTQDVGDTIEWQLEAAHLQQYFLYTRPSSSEEEESASATTTNKSIGPFPEVTTNHRKTDKFHIIRKVDKFDKNTVVAQLYHVLKEEYVNCSLDGKISLAKDPNDPSTEWIMEDSSLGGNTFRSRLYGYYLSHTDGTDATNNNEHVGEIGSPWSSSSSSPSQRRLGSRLFRRSNINTNNNAVAVTKGLIGAKTVGLQESCWDLVACVPRVVNSGKVRTFALGTSLVVGSSLALPFVLVGAGAVLHLGGQAAVAYHVVIAGLSSCDTVSSVGALGATAYLVFRPTDVSLTDQNIHKKEDKDHDRYKRPFCNWRNWD